MTSLDQPNYRDGDVVRHKSFFWFEGKPDIAQSPSFRMIGKRIASGKKTPAVVRVTSPNVV
jgi:hypothetical protein